MIQRNEMIPVIIQDYINKLSEKTTSTESRQFYYSTLLNIKMAIEDAIKDYEKEKHFRK